MSSQNSLHIYPTTFFSLFIILLNPSTALGFLDYTQEKLKNCASPQNQKIYEIDKYLMIFIGPLSLCAASVIIWTFLKFKKSRKQPSDIVFCVSLCDFALSSHWIASSLRQFIYPESSPSQSSVFCEINTILSVISGSLQYLYNILFCVFLITRMRNSIGGKRIRKSLVHILCWSGAIGYYLFLRLSNKTGVNAYGLCSYRVTSDSWIAGIALFSVYLFISIFTLIFFKTYVPDEESFKEQKQIFLRFYYRYAIITCLSWSILALSNSLISLNCKCQWSPIFNIFITVGNTTKLVTPIFLAIVRYRDPSLQQCIQKYKSDKQIENDIEMSLSTTTQILSKHTLQQEIIKKQQQQQQKQSNPQISWSNSLSKNLRSARIQSIFMGLESSDTFINDPPQSIKKNAVVRIYDRKKMNEKRNSTNNVSIHKMRMKVFCEKDFFQLRQSENPPINMANMFSLEKNFSTIEKFTEDAQNGGRSGSLFLINHSGDLVIKTLTQTDVKSFLKMSLNYFKYLNDNQQSTLLVKIYGIFSFKRTDAQDSKTYLLIMKNVLLGIPSQLILRKYDLKGSSHDREVLPKYKLLAKDYNKFSCQDSYFKKDELKNEGEDEEDERQQFEGSLPSWIMEYNTPNDKIKLHKDNKKHKKDISELTLKDIDFQKIEQKVFISKEASNMIKENLIRDSNFLKCNGLIDYSLFLCKAAHLSEDMKMSSLSKSEQDFNNQSYERSQSIDSPQQKQLPSSSIKNSTQMGLHAFQSEREPNIFYHLGVIDYLQLWNIDKLLEQKAKQAINANPRLNVSSQNPQTYQTRFVENVINYFN